MSSNNNDQHKALKQRIEKLKKQLDPVKPDPKNSHKAIFNIAFELVAAIIAGLIIGLFFDNLFDSKPLFLIMCIIVSMIAFFKLIWNKYIGKNGT